MKHLSKYADRYFIAFMFVLFIAVAWSSRDARAQERSQGPTTQPAAPADWRALYSAPQSIDLVSLKPLPIVHYSWPIRPVDVLPTPAWWLADYVRICRGVTIDADSGTSEAHVRALARLASQSGASVAIKHSPYHATAWLDGDPRHTDPAYMEWWRLRLLQLRGWVELEGAHVGAVLYDTECFRIQAPAPTTQPAKSLVKPATATIGWNAALRQRYNEAYQLAKSVFGPNCYVEWYSRGWQRPIGLADVQRYASYIHFDLSERGDGVSYVATRPDWEVPTLVGLTRTAILRPNDPVVIWAWVGGAYRLNGSALSCEMDWDYGATPARALARLPDAIPGRVQFIVLYPAPGTSGASLLRFADYAREAAR